MIEEPGHFFASSKVYTPSPTDERREKTEISKTSAAIVWAGLAACAYVLVMRPFWETLKYSFFIGVPVMAVGLISSLITRKRTVSELRAETGIATLVVGMPIAATLFGLVYYALYAVLKDVVVWAMRVRLDRWVGDQRLYTVLCVSAILTVGAALFWFRLRFRVLYGLSEAMVGVFIGLSRFDLHYQEVTRADTSFYLAFLTASVYLVVRGFDNMHQGLTKGSADWLVGKLLRRVGSAAELLRS